jgi:hypothetical protein
MAAQRSLLSDGPRLTSFSHDCHKLRNGYGGLRAHRRIAEGCSPAMLQGIRQIKGCPRVTALFFIGATGRGFSEFCVNGVFREYRRTHEAKDEAGLCIR